MTNNNLYDMAISHFESKRVESRAMLDLYLNNPSAVADHSNFISEITKWAEQLASSEECLKALKENFSQGGVLI